MIYIINSYGSDKIGHFWAWDGQIRKAYVEAKIKYTYLNPSAKKAEIEDSNIFEKNDSYIDIADGESFVEECIKFISEDLMRTNTKKAVLMIPFLSQFSENQILEFINIDKKVRAEVVIAGITLHTKEATFWQPSRFRYSYQELFENNENCKILWVGENIPNNLKQFKFIRELPDYMDSKIKIGKRGSALCFFGSLNAYRGITEILIAALFNPRMKVKIKGHGYANHLIWRPIKFDLLKFGSWKEKPFVAIPVNVVAYLLSFLKFLPNVDFENSPFPTEAELEKAISESAAMFYCAKLPYGSGIVNKTLFVGKPIIWMGTRGRAYEVLKDKFPNGRISYGEIFIPNRIQKKLGKVVELKSQPAINWDQFVSEITIVRNYL